MSKFGKSPYYQTAIERHREQFREDVAKMVRKRPTGTRRVSAINRTKRDTIQAVEY